jgi:hypothetical protein
VLPATTATTTFTAVGMSAPNTSGTASAQPALSGATRMYIRYATATSGGLAGLSGPFTQTRQQYRPRLVGIVLSDTATTNRRMWFGIASAALTAITHATGPTASTVHFVALGYDTSISTAWRCCSGDGTNRSCADITGTTVAASTEYTLVVDWTSSGSLTCRVQAGSGAAISVNKTTNLSASTSTDLGVFNGTTALEAVTKNHNIARHALDQY